MSTRRGLAQFAIRYIEYDEDGRPVGTADEAVSQNIVVLDGRVTASWAWQHEELVRLWARLGCRN